MTLEELRIELRELNGKAKVLLSKSKFLEYDDLSGLDMNYNDPEELFVRDELRTVMEHLTETYYTLAYLDRPVEYVGKLSRRPDGRFGTEDGFYYTSGSLIEVLIDDPENGDPARWVSTSVEHAGDYFLVGYRNVPMDGLAVRRRVGGLTG